MFPRSLRPPAGWSRRSKLQPQLAELPPPADSNVIAFDRTGERLLPIATIIREATLVHQSALVKHIVERVTIKGGEVEDIALRPEARPFYAGLVVAPPDGRRAPVAIQLAREAPGVHLTQPGAGP
jgi:hypothetical protein